MPMTPAELDRLIQQPEGQTLEFKAAESNFNFDRLCKYCSALANEMGGFLILGVSDRVPRRVLGTQAFLNPTKTQKGLFDTFRFRVEIETVIHSDKRVLVFQVPSRDIGIPVLYDGRAWMRVGESLVSMSWDQLRKISDEVKPDWLEEYSKINLTSRHISDLLDMQGYFRLREYPSSGNQEGAVARLLSDRIIHRQNNSYSIPRLSALALAKDLGDFPELGHKIPRVIVYDGNSKIKTRIDRDFRNGYAAGFQTLIQFIMSQLPQNEVIEDSLRRESKLVPDIVIREFVANALVHQDFSISGRSIRVEIYNNRVEISNPGTPLIPFDRFIDEEESRNENLTSLMRRLGICEEKGSGVDQAIFQIEFSQLPAPQFRPILNGTSVVIYGPKQFEDMSRKDRIRACYQHCALMWVMNKDMNNESLRKRFGLPEAGRAKISQLIAQTVEEGLVKRVGTSRRLARYLPHWAGGTGAGPI